MKTLRIAALVCAALAVTALAACSSPSAPKDGAIQVVAAENFWGDVAEQVGGSRVQVTSVLANPEDDPHEYESSTRNAIAVATSRLVIQNGLGYDDFMGKLVDSSGAHPSVITVAQVLGITGAGANPHLWYDAAGLPKVAEAIAAELSTIDPEHRGMYAANAAAFVADLKPLDQTIAQIKREYSGTKIAYTERVPGYLVEEAGLKLGIPAGFPQAVEDGSDPSPQDTIAFDDAIENKTVKVLLYNAQVADTQTTQIKQAAIRAGVPIVGVTETMPTSFRHLQDWQLAQAEDLLAALRKAES